MVSASESAPDACANFFPLRVCIPSSFDFGYLWFSFSAGVFGVWFSFWFSLS